MTEPRRQASSGMTGDALRIAVIGGGPGGLYAALLLKKQDPRRRVTVFERNAADVTFGWGVVFSAETLDNLAAADPESFAAIRARFRYWDDIDIHDRGTVTTSTGHGFCGFARRDLLLVLQERCRSLGVDVCFETEAPPLSALAGHDLIVAADGINSAVREQLAHAFEPSLDWRRCKFAWLGTTRPMDAFAFIVQDTPYGLIQAHAYPYEDGLATFIPECREEVWQAAGLADATEDETVAFCQDVFADFLDGHPLLSNKSIWRSFPTIRCARWHAGNVVLLGDAAHTAHFSIGSGTKLAMEDAIALAEALAAHGTADMPATLQAYEDDRFVEVAKTQHAAQTSLEWFENAARYRRQPPTLFAFNLLTRSKRITWDNLAVRDAAFIERVRDAYAASVGAKPMADGTLPPPAFTPFALGGLTLVNRIVVSPMCQYVARDGLPDDWHLVHLGSRAIGGAGLVMTEMTDVSPDARITPGCAGLWCDDHMRAWRRIVDFVHAQSRAKIGIQLGHAGRKGSTCVPWEGEDDPLTEGGWELLAPSPLPYKPQSDVPRAMDRADMDRVVAEHVRAAQLAEAAGFDLLELHCAHGYLLATFLSPLTNRRDDAYGGDLAGRLRFPLEVFGAVRAAWPAHMPMSVRISATDWAEGGTTGDDSVAIARAFADHGAAIVDVSAGQTVTEASPVYGRMFQVPWSDRIRHEAGVPTMAVGAIEGVDHANTILAAGRADLCAMARPHLRDPYLTLHAAEAYGVWEQAWPDAYLTVKPRPPRQGPPPRRALPPREAGEAGDASRGGAPGEAYQEGAVAEADG